MVFGTARQLEAGRVTGNTAVEAPRCMGMAVAFDTQGTIGQELYLFDRIPAAAPRPSAARVLPNFISRDAQRDVALDIFDRIIARIGIQRVNAVEPVLAEASAIAAFEDLDVHPLSFALKAAESDRLQIGDPGAYFVRYGGRQCFHQRVGNDVTGREAC